MINVIKNNTEAFSCEIDSASVLKSPRICKLGTLGVSEPATVIGLNTSTDLHGRLMGMGLTIGARIEVLQKGRFKPLLIGVGESRIAMGRDIADMVLVEPEESVRK